MTKFILIVCAALLVYLLVKKVRRSNRNVQVPLPFTAGEDMVRCVQCGINLPRSESLLVHDQYYCCPEHQQQHRTN